MNGAGCADGAGCAEFRGRKILLFRDDVQAVQEVQSKRNASGNAERIKSVISRGAQK